MYFFLVSFMILGAGIKYVDAAYDEKTFSKKFALVAAPLLGILWAYTMIVNNVAATILLAVVLAVVIKGKIDNLAHLSGVLVIVPVIFLAGIQLMWIPLVFLAAAALIDEIGNDYVDKKKNIFNDKNKFLGFVKYFFDHRWMMKVAILSLVLIGSVPVYFFFAMLLFDYAYLGVRIASDIKQGETESLILPKIWDIKQVTKAKKLSDEYSVA